MLNETEEPVTAVGFAYDAATRDWTLRTEYVARNRQEAWNWIQFNRNWMKNLHIAPESAQ